MCVHTHTNIHIHTHTYIQTHTHTHIHIHTHTHQHTHTHTHKHRQRSVLISTDSRITLDSLKNRKNHTYLIEKIRKKVIEMENQS